MLSVANLKENDSPRVRVQGQVCQCYVLPLKENILNIMCTTPELNPNSSVAIVELITGSIISKKAVSLVQPLMRLNAVGSTTGIFFPLQKPLNQLSLSSMYTTPLVISPFLGNYSPSDQDSAV